jgi:pyruvate/2-oxoglutarate/acetoin dehydrogenase E1 component
MATTTDAQQSYNAAIDAAIADEMRRDAGVCLFATMVSPEFRSEFGGRARITPISEAAMTGVAVGLAVTGKRPIVNWRNATFSFNAFDQVINHAAKARYMSGGQVRLPIVFRAPCGGGDGMAAQHSQSPFSIYAHIAGIKAVVPSTPADAAGLVRAAIRDDNPVVIFEPARLAATSGLVPGSEVIPLGEAEIRRAGTDVTVLALGSMVPLALAAAEEGATDGISVEVVDPRTISPLDVQTIHDSVRRTGRLVVADEASAPYGFGAEVLAVVAEDPETLASLKASPKRVGALHVPVPFSEPLEQHVLPGKDEIVEAISVVTR